MSTKCLECGSDCNEIDELAKAEREIDRLKHALAKSDDRLLQTQAERVYLLRLRDDRDLEKKMRKDAEEDAENYRWIKQRTCAVRDIIGRPHFGFPTRIVLPPVGDISQGDVGQHLSDAIAAQIAVSAAVGDA